MQNWKLWNIGDAILYHWDEFDGKGSLLGILVEKHEDHAIVEAAGMHLWVSNETIDLFKHIA